MSIVTVGLLTLAFNFSTLAAVVRPADIGVGSVVTIGGKKFIKISENKYQAIALNCITGYYLDGTTCATCPTGCATCSSASSCGSCTTGYQLGGTTCYATPAAPASITIPATIYTGQTVRVSWTASTNATGYILEGKCGAGDYAGLYEGSNLTFDNDITVCTGPVQYRVKAYNTQTTIASNWTESESRNVTSCMVGCNKCASSTTCESDGCASGYTRQTDGTCKLNCNDSHCNSCGADSNPATCDPTGCATGYHVESGVCVNDIDASAYCQTQGSAGDLQTWGGCSSLATPASGSYTQGPCLTDSRDGKVYQVRKFADGKCWMVENLRYGGTTTSSGSTDYCKSKTGSYTKGYTDGTKNTGWYGRVGTNATATGTVATLYGDCRDPATTNTAPCTTGSTACGYLYNWQAAMQLPDCNYNNSSCSYPNGTPTITNHIQGICPVGWHLPSGGTSNTTSEFVKLDVDNGSPATDFWLPGGAWKGLHSGSVNYDGTFSIQGSHGYWWSSSENSTMYGYSLGVYSSSVGPQSYSGKYNGMAVRCVKN